MRHPVPPTTTQHDFRVLGAVLERKARMSRVSIVLKWKGMATSVVLAGMGTAAFFFSSSLYVFQYSTQPFSLRGETEGSKIKGKMWVK